MRKSDSRSTTGSEPLGPVGATVEITGDLPRVRNLRIRARLSFYAGTGLVKMEVGLHNPNRAWHREAARSSRRFRLPTTNF